MQVQVKNRKKTKARRVKKLAKTKAATAELTRLGSALRTLGGLGGGAVGSIFGAPGTGSAMGTNLGAALSRWLGSGDYTVTANSIVHKASTSVPAMHKTDQRVIVRHKEYLGEIKSSQNFTIQQTLPLNPGVATTFPWLAAIANGFTEYTFKGVVFHYIPLSGSAIASTNNALGSVIFNTNYRANDVAPLSKFEALNEYFSCDAEPSEAFVHPIECDPKENPFNVQYIRSTSVPSSDLMHYDLGTTYIATSGMQADGITVGEVWVTYEVELRKPRANLTLLSPAAYLGSNGGGPSTSMSQLATSLSNAAYNGLLQAITAPNATTLRMTFNQGAYGSWSMTLMGSADAGAATTSWSSSPNYVNCTEISTLPRGQANNSSGSHYCFYVNTCVKITQQQSVAYVDFSCNTFVSLSNVVLHVAPIPYNYV